jgi:hypothetical protein
MTQASDSRKAHWLPGGPSSPLTRLTLLRAALSITLQQKPETENTADYPSSSNPVGAGLFRIRHTRSRHNLFAQRGRPNEVRDGRLLLAREFDADYVGAEFGLGRSGYDRALPRARERTGEFLVTEEPAGGHHFDVEVPGEERGNSP